MVQNVEEFGAKLHLHPLGNRGVLVESEVPLLVGGTNQRVAPEVAVMPRAGHAIGWQTRDGPRCWYRAWRRPSGRCNWRVALVVDDGPDHIRTIETIAAATEIVFAIVVEGKGLAALQ